MEKDIRNETDNKDNILKEKAALLKLHFLYEYKQKHIKENLLMFVMDN